MRRSMQSMMVTSSTGATQCFRCDTVLTWPCELFLHRRQALFGLAQAIATRPLGSHVCRIPRMHAATCVKQTRIAISGCTAPWRLAAAGACRIVSAG
jgi:hypothetical protein